MAGREIYRLRTIHKTEMFLNENMNIVHRNSVNIPDGYIPIYASPKDNGVLLFFVKDNRINYIQDFADSANYFIVDTPAVIGIVKNADGSVALKQGDRFWSARRESGRFDLRAKASAWEHIFLDKADVTLDDLIASNDKEVFNVGTIHKTAMFLSADMNIVHRSSVNIPDGYIPIYASPKDDGVLLFFVKDNRVNYIQSFTDSKNYFIGDTPAVIGIVKNADGSVALKQGNRFWSARRESGRFDLRAKALAWEHIFLNKADVTFNELIASDAQPSSVVEQTVAPDDPQAKEDFNSMDKEVYRIGTIHKTELYVTDKGKVRHFSIEDVPIDDMPIYAILEGTGLILFYIKNERLSYVQGVTNDGFKFGETPVLIDIVKHENGSISFKGGNKFLSARQNIGTFDLRPKAQGWEQFTLLKTEFKLLAADGSTSEAPTSVVNNDRCRISIVIPVLDGVSIDTALGSIVKQTFKDYEVVLVNGLRAEDSSLDDVIDDALKNELGDKLSIVKAGTNTKTLGVLFNIGINCAGGRYIMLMDGSDELTSTALQELYTTANHTNADALLCTEVKTPVRVRFDVAERIRKFVNGDLGMEARGRLLKREFLLSNRVEFPRLKAADEQVYSFYLACLAENYVLASNECWKFGATVEDSSEELSFFMVTNEAFEALDKFMNDQEFFKRLPEYRYVVLNCINENCKKYLNRGNMTPYEFYEAVLKEVKANRVAFNRTAFLAYNFCTANWQYAQILKKDREIRALNAEIKKAKEENAAKTQEEK